jgi:type II secretory pathway component PulM
MTISQVLETTPANEAIMLRTRPTSDSIKQYDTKPLFTGNKRGWVILDATTAHMLRTIRGAMRTEAAQAKFDRIPLPRLVEFGWSHVK